MPASHEPATDAAPPVTRTRKAGLAGQLRGASTRPDPAASARRDHRLPGPGHRRHEALLGARSGRKQKVQAELDRPARVGRRVSTEQVGDYLTGWLDAIQQDVRYSTWRAHETIVPALPDPALGIVASARSADPDRRPDADHQAWSNGASARDGVARSRHSPSRRSPRRSGRPCPRNVASLARPPKLADKEAA